MSDIFDYMARIYKPKPDILHLNTTNMFLESLIRLANNKKLSENKKLTWVINTNHTSEQFVYWSQKAEILMVQ